MSLTTRPRTGDWMQTATGRQFWPLDPRPEDICIEDIAHALAHQCRYAGHCLRFYSVAEHCVLLTSFVSDSSRLWALLHDAAEAYLVDVPRPLKPFLTGYREAEARLMQAIATRFDLQAMEPEDVKVADRRILTDEMRQNMAKPPASWVTEGVPLGARLQFWPPGQARAAFLARFFELGGREANAGVFA